MHRPIKLPECPLTDLGSEIRDLMREAADVLELQNVNATTVHDLLARLNGCSDRSAALGLAYSQQQLDRVADLLKQRFDQTAG